MSTGIRRLNDPAGVDEHGTPRTDTVRDLILRNTAVGLPAEIAAQAAGISARTFVLWLQAGRSALTEIDKDPQVPLTDDQRIAAQFATDIDRSLAEWLGNANRLLESETTGRRIVITRETTDEHGGITERSVTTREEPGELGRLAWRMGKVSPVYGRERIELTGVDGGPVEVDIGARLAQIIGEIRATLSVERADSELLANGNGHDESFTNGEEGI